MKPPATPAHEPPTAVLQALLEKHYARRCAERQALVTSLKFEFDQALDGTGWYVAETLPPDGGVRWTGPGPQATFDLPLATDHDLDIKFRVLMGVTPDILRSLKLNVNDQPIQLISHSDPTSGIILQGRIPQSVLKQGSSFARLTFKVKRTLAPNTRPPANADTRLLGVLFNWIQISPAPLF